MPGWVAPGRASANRALPAHPTSVLIRESTIAVEPASGPVLRQASGLPSADVIRDAKRVGRVGHVLAGSGSSTVLRGLVRLSAQVTNADCAQLSLLAEQQIAVAVRCEDGGYAEHVSALEDSVCTVTALSGDVLVAADARSHPWLHDLPPVLSGAVGSYLGVPLPLADGTVVGVLCVYGPLPRAWTDSDVTLVCAVADVLTLELRRLDQG